MLWAMVPEIKAMTMMLMIYLCVCSISMYHERVGEFWYQLEMCAEPPAPTVLPVMECELGRWTRQEIVLSVPSDDSVIVVEPCVSNTDDFTLEYNVSSPLEIKDGCPLIVPLTFVPSMLGTADQSATIVFTSQQVREAFTLFTLHPTIAVTCYTLHSLFTFTMNIHLN